MALESFNAYHSYLTAIEPLNDAERGRLFTALLTYSSTGEVPDLRGNERFVFPQMKWQIDRDKGSYDDFCARQSENGKKGGRPKKPPVNSETQKTQAFFEKPKKANNKDKDKDKDKDISFPPDGVKDSARAHRPTVEEVAAYCRERGNSVDAERFVDFYASKGWKVGNQPMKDWKACVRTWEKREAPAEAPKKTAPARMPQGDDLGRLERLLALQQLKGDDRERLGKMLGVEIGERS